MSTLSSVRYQCRNFDSTYLFKVKNESEISLKILDLSQKCLFKKTFSAKELSFPNTPQLLTDGNFNLVLERLVEKHLLPKEHLAANPKEVTQKTCEKLLDQVIEQFKPKVFVERKEIDGFTCPLTLTIFEKPVMDNHGHTFEKDAIEKHLENKNECPLNRQPIDSLTPNRLVQQAIEEWQKLDPIPTFSLFQKDNSKLASTNLQLAQTYVDEKEYTEALECYAKAFQFTRKWEDYMPLPSLFETMGEYEKATLAYLYLAKYQLQAGKIPKAIQTLEACQKGKSAYLQNNLVLIELYYLIGEPEKALKLAIQTAEAFSKQSFPEQAAAIYRCILRDHHPSEFSLYSKLAACLKTSHEKRQILLKGALQALQKRDCKSAERLALEANSYCEDSFIDQLVFLELIEKQEQIPKLKQKLLYLATAFEKKELTHQMLSTYKMLFQLEKEPQYCQKILSAYQTLQKPQKEFKWLLTLLALLIEKKEWAQAGALAKQTLQKTQESQQTTFLYEKLEEIHTHWNGHELQDLWPKLGKAYQESKELYLAEKTYRKAFERFHRFEDALALAEVLKETGSIDESVHIYYEASIEALLEKNTDRLSLCAREIKQIDPHLQHLDLNQRMHLLTQENILRLSEELYTAHKQIALLEQVAQPLIEKTIQKEIKRAELERKLKEELSQAWFGKAKWEKYFGDVGVEPPLPKDIVEVLKSPCPYWEGKRVEETHILVLIPKTINGRPLKLNRLADIIRNPQGGGNASYLRTSISTSINKSGKLVSIDPISSSYWALITKDILPNSQDKPPYDQQTALIKDPYKVPGLLEIVTGLLSHYVQTGEKLYSFLSENVKSYTKCQEYHTYDGVEKNHVVVSFHHSLDVDVYDRFRDRYPIGLGGVRRF